MNRQNVQDTNNKEACDFFAFKASFASASCQAIARKRSGSPNSHSAVNHGVLLKKTKGPVFEIPQKNIRNDRVDHLPVLKEQKENM